MEEEIKAEFERSGFTLDQEEDILKKCLTFCINYKLTASDLVSSWEVYYLNRQLNGSVVQNGHMDGFLLHLQNEHKEILIKEEAHPHIYSSNDVDMILSEEHEENKEETIGTPVDQKERLYTETIDSTPGTNGIVPSSGKPSRLSTGHVTPFGQRTNKFVVQFTLNEFANKKENDSREQEIVGHEDDIIRRVQPSERCSLEVQRSRPESGCRFMYDKIEDKFNSLENRIRRLTTAFVASGLYEESVDPTMASQKSAFSVGMISCDGEGRLNEKSILLQGSVEQSGGQRVRLDLQKLTQYSFFPGQVVGVEGHNPCGHCLVASKVFDSFPFSVSPDVEFPPAKKQAMDHEFQPDSPSSTPEKLSLVIAAGPFTTTDNLLFEPLVELLAYATRKQPQLLMLLGPFIDSEHPEIRKGTIDRSFDDIFHSDILRRLQDYAKYMGSAARVVLVPSLRDAFHDFVFPQPAFDIHSDLKNQITCLPNPGLFDANKKTCLGFPFPEVSCRLSEHFYPLYPPSEDVPLDLSLAPEALQIPSIPDIIILPSDLSPFVKVLALGEKTSTGEQTRCIAVNPGRLAKGVGGGTFVEINYHENPDRTHALIFRM
ncbi:hypothetical protein IFM89_013089 [Coptis chinensis]|uniref:DNA polymerase alpha subunit B n=1 Tax=Coptis chinensis TaxID=261450 RepID=A0A835IPT2_9MAGN|nr:hypothetical protein IFM89_013089 [Coptis chinensis]